MCITFFKLESPGSTTSSFPLIIAFNRDEMTYRLSSPAAYHDLYPNVLCGLDLQTGSTWFAVNRATGDFCFLTNFRTPANYTQRGKKYGSRGHLVMEYVKIHDPTITDKKYTSLADYERALVDTDTRGFNIVFGNAVKGSIKYY